MKHYAVILSLLLCLSLLIGCGAQTTESTDPAESTQEVQETPETTTDETTDEETEEPAETEEAGAEETEEPEETDDPELMVEEEPVELEHPLAILPVNEKIELTDPMADGTYHVSFGEADLMNAGDTFLLTAEFFDYDRYDAAEVEQLQVGDTIEVCGETVTVETVDFLTDEATGDIYVININGGMDVGGVSLMSNTDKTVYRTFTWNDHPLYYSLGEMGCVISSDIVLLDQGDDPSNEPTESDFSALPGWVSDMVTGYYSEYSTTITVENGEVTTIERIYTP